MPPAQAPQSTGCLAMPLEKAVQPPLSSEELKWVENYVANSHRTNQYREDTVIWWNNHRVTSQVFRLLNALSSLSGQPACKHYSLMVSFPQFQPHPSQQLLMTATPASRPQSATPQPQSMTATPDHRDDDLIAVDRYLGSGTVEDHKKHCPENRPRHYMACPGCKRVLSLGTLLQGHSQISHDPASASCIIRVHQIQNFKVLVTRWELKDLKHQEKDADHTYRWDDPACKGLDSRWKVYVGSFPTSNPS